MKKIIVALLLISANLLSAQTFTKINIDSVTGLVIFNEVVKVDSITQLELYSRGRQWFAVNFNSAKSVLEMEDKELGKLIGNAFQDIYFTKSFLADPPTKCYYTISLFVKDGKYKLVVSNFKIQAYPSQYDLNPKKYSLEQYLTNKPDEDKGNQEIKVVAEILKVTNSISESIKTAMKTSVKKDDW
jgi:hypothetical protein